MPPRVAIFTRRDLALAGCSLLVRGAYTSARSQTLPWPILELWVCGLNSKQEAVRGSAPVAFLFGCERVSLTNDKLQKCHFYVQIQANPQYSSLNLAIMVQMLTYEVRVAWLESQRQNATAHEASIYPLAEDSSFTVSAESGQIDIVQPTGLRANKSSTTTR